MRLKKKGEDARALGDADLLLEEFHVSQGFFIPAYITDKNLNPILTHCLFSRKDRNKACEYNVNMQIYLQR